MPHINKLYDYTVSAFIVCDNKILLVHHKALKTWLPIGGHIELDETPDEALYREIYEECGLRSEDLCFIDTRSFKPQNSQTYKQGLQPVQVETHVIHGVHSHISLDYVAESDTDTVSLAPSEHHGIGWYTLQQLKKLTPAPPENVILTADYAMRLVKSKKE